jgi:pyruvate/2-oxoglutarate dehydrogenase complex dihydrolipoamide dehydrogenase (E3) component
MPDQDFDLIAIGGGTAGLVAASGAAYLGARVALIERSALGGDCLWTGCVPSKALLASARTAATLRGADRHGLTSVTPVIETASVLERVRAARARVAEHDDPEKIRARGIDVIFGTARFSGPGRLDVEGMGALRSSRIVIATGARPTVPPLPGLEAAGFLTHEDVFDLQDLPRSVVILGAGPIGMEFAQAFARLGVDVTVVEMRAEVLPASDPEAAAVVREALTAEGVAFRLGVTVDRVEMEDDRRVLHMESGDRIGADAIFVATGRRPHLAELNLERAGVRTDEAGAVAVNSRLATNVRGIWAAGDVAGGPQFTHAADAMAKTVVRNALLPFSSRSDLSNVPTVTYTDPELAELGLSRADAESRGGTTYRYSFSDLDRAIADDTTEGFARITADSRGRILGATVVARGAGDLIMPLVLARRHKLTLADISNTTFPYPTMAEGVKRTADAFQRARLEGKAGTLLRKVVGWLT